MNDKNPINLSSAYPITDEEGKSLIPYEFTITNTCNSFASYQINLEILNTTTLENLEYLKVMLDSKVNLLTENESVTKTLENAKTSYKLQPGYLRENQRKTFSLRLWMDEDTPTSEEFMNKLFESKITVIATYKENLDNNIEVSSVSQNESFSGSETFLIHATSENYDLVSMSDDLESWEELETKGKDITVEKTVTANGSHTFYFQDEAGNVKEVTVNATKIDDKKPIANMSVAKENNVIKIDASSSRDNETSISKYYFSKDGINYEESTKNKFQFTNEYQYGTATTTLTNFEKKQIKKVYLKVEDEIGNASDIREYNIISTDFAYDETSDNNLRYIGASPNNYVSFNNELWRIIGVMNNIDDGAGKKETRIKLIRNESVGNYSWDTSPLDINQASGVNEWSQADVMKIMNPGFDSESVGGSLYWNKQNGYCYSGYNNETTACDFTSIGLTDDSKKMIDTVIWNIGSNSTGIIWNNIKTNDFYILERSINTGKICTSGIRCTDNINRTTKWYGKVGLLYPSDYGYASIGIKSNSNEDCLAQTLYSWSESSMQSCSENNWLSIKNYAQHTMTPAAYSDQNNTVFVIARYVGAHNAYYSYNSDFSYYAIRPVIYLKSSVKITSGLGTEQSPFTLSLN